jgi:hypothetical protein
LSPSVKRAFLNLQIAIAQTVRSDNTSVGEADAYMKMSSLLLSIQKDYEDLLGYYELTKQKKKPLSVGIEQEQQPNLSTPLYQFRGRV